LPDSYLERLNGKKHLILGNHDKDWVKKADLSKHFASVAPLAEISTGQQRMTLCHYPMMSWNHMAKGAYMIHGHIHNNRNADYFPLMQKMPNLLNAGVDVNGFRPVKLGELIANNESFKSGRTEQEKDTGDEAAQAPNNESFKSGRAEQEAAVGAASSSAEIAGIAGIAERLNELAEISLRECKLQQKFKVVSA
jgi:hypothetical protein